ncbi:MAG: hypothetical protein IH950_09290 [Bacteroidetes bacterium]|nr:hypothetical protein [Bacteroidota bacterium]
METQDEKIKNELSSLIEIIGKMNLHFFPEERIDIEHREDGRIHLIKGTQRIFITKNAEFTGACNGVIPEYVH